MRPSTVRNVQFSVLILLAVAAYLYVSWNTAGAQSADPTPVCTVTPDGMFCTSSVAMTMTPTNTPVAPTAESTLTPFEPTATLSPTPTNTRRPTFTPTAIVISPLPTPTPLTITVSGHAYIDIDDDGAQDANEGGAGGIVVVATNPTTSLAHSARTDANGYFVMSLQPGRYIITAHCPGLYYGIWLCYDEDYPSLTDGAYIAIPIEPYRVMLPIVSRL